MEQANGLKDGLYSILRSFSHIVKKLWSILNVRGPSAGSVCSCPPWRETGVTEVHGHFVWADDWICLFFFSLASFPSSALALTSLFFLHPARAPINAIEVTFSLGLVQRPDASPFKKVILFFFSLSVSHAHPSRCVDCCFLFILPRPRRSDAV